MAARSATARLLLSSASSPIRPNHRHHHLSRRLLLLLPVSRSKTSSSSNPPHASPRRDTTGAARNGAAQAGHRPSLFQEISGIVAPDTGTASYRPFPPHVTEQVRRGDEDLVHCMEDVCRNAHESVLAASASTAGETPVPDGCSDNEGGPRGSDAPRWEPCCEVARDGHAQDSDIDSISADVQRITEVLRSEVPGSSTTEQRLGSMGLAYTPRMVNMVLKRCFKKKHLGLRFFYWVKRLPGFSHTTGTYNTMLYIAGEAKSFGTMEDLMSEMDKDMCPKDIKTWTIIIASYGKAREIPKMLSTFHALRKSGSVVIDTRVYREVLRALCHDARSELAIEFYKDMPMNMDIGSDVLRLLLCLLAGSNNAEAVLSVRDDMIKSMKYPEEYCYLEALRSFCVSGKLADAYKLFQQMKNKSMDNSSALEILLRGLCKSGMMDEALKVMEHMKSRSFINSTTFGFLIDGYLRQGDRAKALELLQAMREYGCVPLASSYTQLMQHMFTFDQYEAACELYKEMQETGAQPDIVTITALIGGHIRHRHISEAWDVLRKMNENGQRLTMKAYTVLIQELCKASMPLQSLTLLKEMLDSDFRPSEGTFCRVISALRDNQYLEEASNVERIRASFNFKMPNNKMIPGSFDNVDILNELQQISKSDKDEKQITFESICHASDEGCEVSKSSLCDDMHPTETTRSYSDDDVEEICQILSSDNWSSMQQALEMRSLHFSPNLVTAIMKRCKRNSHAALNFFSWVGRRSYYMHTTETYSAAMKLAGSAKDFKHMRHLYKEMLRAQCSPTTGSWNVMICQYGNAGLTEMALQTFDQMKQDGFQPDKTTYDHLLMYLSRRKGRKLHIAVKIFKEMTDAGYILENAVLCEYLSALCDCGMLANARSSVVSLCKKGFAVQVGYNILFKSLCRSDKMEEAISLFDDIEKQGCSRDEYMYGSLIHALLRWDRFEDAVAKLVEMKNAGMSQSTHMYTSFIIYFFRKRDVPKAMGVLNEMIKNGCEPTVVTYSALIRGHMDMGMVSEAWDVFRQMKLSGPSPDFQTYSMFMTYLCKAGRSEEGLKLINDMLDGGIIIPSTVNFRTVVHGLNMEGKHKIADTVLQSKWNLRRQRTFSNSLVDSSFV